MFRSRSKQKLVQISLLSQIWKVPRRTQPCYKPWNKYGIATSAVDFALYLLLRSVLDELRDQKIEQFAEKLTGQDLVDFVNKKQNLWTVSYYITAEI